MGHSVGEDSRLQSVNPDMSHINSHVRMRACTVISTASRRGRHPAHKMIGPSWGTFSVPYTSILRKNVVIALPASATSGPCDAPNGMLRRLLAR